MEPESKSKLSQLADWVRIKLFGPESHKVHLLDFEIFTAWIAIALVIFGTFVGIYRAQHWQWGVLNHIPVISTIFNGGHHGTNTNGGSGSSGGSSTAGSGKSGGSTVKMVHNLTKGGLHTAGTQILDGNNKVVRLYSIGDRYMLSSTGGGCIPPQRSKPNYFDNLRAWGINTVYLALGWGGLEPTAPTFNSDGSVTHHFSSSWLTRLDQTISDYHAHGIATVLKMNVFADQVRCKYSLPSWLFHIYSSGSLEQSACNFISDIKDDNTVPGVGPMEDLGEAWKGLVTHYKNNPAVIGIDMINEPYSGNFPNCPTYDLDKLYRVVGAKIRAANPNMLLMFEEDSTANADRGVWALSGPIPYKNSVYVIHIYADGWDQHGSGNCEFSHTASRAFSNFWNRAGSPGWNIPIWMEEFNELCYNQGNTGDVWSAGMDGIMSYIKSHGMSMGITGYSGPSGVVDSNGNIEQVVVDKLRQGL